MNTLQIKKALESFLLEDIGQGDLSTDLVFSQNTRGTGQFLVKETGILSGMDIPNLVYELLGEEVSYTALKQDGDYVEKGTVIATVSGSVRGMLTGERVILNLMQRMSGIATLTNQAVRQLNDSSIRICDTRKTAPGLRLFDKYAVTCGGGYNHRIGLYDGVMLKDNHIAYAGGILPAVKRVRSQLGHMVKIEVEIETKEELLEAIQAECDVIMFDNRSPREVKEFQKLVPSSILTEISGGITLETISTYQGTGANYLSLGFLTHSVKALDISFNSNDIKESNHE